MTTTAAGERLHRCARLISTQPEHLAPSSPETRSGAGAGLYPGRFAAVQVFPGVPRVFDAPHQQRTVERRRPFRKLRAIVEVTRLDGFDRERLNFPALAPQFQA